MCFDFSTQTLASSRVTAVCQRSELKSFSKFHFFLPQQASMNHNKQIILPVV